MFIMFMMRTLETCPKCILYNITYVNVFLYSKAEINEAM